MSLCKNLPLRLKGMIFTTLGSILIVLVCLSVWQSIRAAGFDSAQGSVISTRLKSTGTGRLSSHTPLVQYSYTVGGVHYSNDVYRFHSLNGDGEEDWARSVVNQYAIGAACTVYYDPSNPQTSALDIETRPKDVVEMALYGLLGLVSLALGVGMLSVRRPLQCAKCLAEGGTCPRCRRRQFSRVQRPV